MTMGHTLDCRRGCFFYAKNPDEFWAGDAHFPDDTYQNRSAIITSRKKVLDFFQKRIYDKKRPTGQIEKNERKENIMTAKNFAPMMSRTMKALLAIKPENLIRYFDIIITYPNHKIPPELENDPIVSAIVEELDRQYENYTTFEKRKGGAE